MIEDLLRDYASGNTDAQHRLLDEVEPLLFGYLRSLAPPGPDAHGRAVALANALTLAFHLRACGGGVRVGGVKELKAYAHRMAARKLAEEDPVPLRPLADPETGSMVYRCFGLGLALEAELSPEEVDLFAERLAGAGLTDLARERGVPVAEVEAAWQRMQPGLRAAGVL